MLKQQKNEVSFPQILTFASFVGLVASFWQAAERVHMLKYPDQPLNCNMSPVVDCGGVLNDRLAAVFGPPNALIGIVVFAMLFALGIQRLLGGSWTVVTRKVAVFLTTLIMAFSLWFFGVSLYILGKICIFCVFIWAASMPIGIYGARDFLNSLKKPTGIVLWKRDMLNKYHFTVLVTVYAVMILLFLLKFQDYYFG
ncbi:hypothetical protein KC992_00605 [Candidatus Saccharibacteria bacterium]|nr:hypothetical protein [Candidatus Saccharibacteria bacterium]